MSGQLSLFSAGTRPPELADLEGLLAGTGHVVRRGAAARVSVVVPAAVAWRVEALVAQLARLELTADVAPAGARDGITVRTPFTAGLVPLAERWSVGATKRPPVGFRLDGARLRWWCLAAGRVDPPGYALGLDPTAELSWAPLGAALAGAGVPGTLLGPRAAGPAYRILGARRLARLRELVGDQPAGPAGGWPTATFHRQAPSRG